MSQLQVLDKVIALPTDLAALILGRFTVDLEYLWIYPRVRRILARTITWLNYCVRVNFALNFHQLVAINSVRVSSQSQLITLANLTHLKSARFIFEKDYLAQISFSHNLVLFLNQYLYGRSTPIRLQPS